MSVTIDHRRKIRALEAKRDQLILANRSNKDKLDAVRVELKKVRGKR